MWRSHDLSVIITLFSLSPEHRLVNLKRSKVEGEVYLWYNSPEAFKAILRATSQLITTRRHVDIRSSSQPRVRIYKDRETKSIYRPKIQLKYYLRILGNIRNKMHVSIAVMTGILS